MVKPQGGTYAMIEKAVSQALGNGNGHLEMAQERIFA